MTRQPPKHASPGVRKTVLALRRVGASPRRVREETGVPPSTQRRWVSKSKDFGGWSHKPALPLPRKKRKDFGVYRKLSRDTLDEIHRNLIDKPHLTVNELKVLVPGLQSISRQHLSWIIKYKLNLPSRVALKKPLLSERQIAKRQAWSTELNTWSKQKLSSILFSDETHIELWQNGAGYHRRVRRGPNDNKYLPKFLKPTVKFPPKLMIWAAFGNGKLGDIHVMPPNVRMNSEYYKGVMRKHLRRSMRKTRTEIFMQDGAKCHTSKVMQEWFRKKSISLLDWPAQSPDMNPIENLWTMLKKLIYTRFARAKNLEELSDYTKAAWSILGREYSDYIKNLSDSMETRVKACLDANGAHTRW